MANILDLPDEVLLQIFQCVSAIDILKNLVLVCKRFHGICQTPEAGKIVQCGLPVPAKKRGLLDKIKSTFPRRSRAKPSLFQWSKLLEIYPTIVHLDIANSAFQRTIASFLASQTTLFHVRSLRITISPVTYLDKFNKSGLVDLELPNLQSLALDYVPEPAAVPSSNFYNFLNVLLTSWSSVNSLDISCCDPYAVNIDSILDCLRISQICSHLESLSIGELGCKTFQWHVLRLCRSLKHLSVGSSNPNPKDFWKNMTELTSLESLETTLLEKDWNKNNDKIMIKVGEWNDATHFGNGNNIAAPESVIKDLTLTVIGLDLDFYSYMWSYWQNLKVLDFKMVDCTLTGALSFLEALTCFCKSLETLKLTSKNSCTLDDRKSKFKNETTETMSLVSVKHLELVLEEKELIPMKKFVKTCFAKCPEICRLSVQVYHPEQNLVLNCISDFYKKQLDSLVVKHCPKYKVSPCMLKSWQRRHLFVSLIEIQQ